MKIRLKVHSLCARHSMISGASYYWPASCPGEGDGHPPRRRNVFERLSDHRFYTGTSRQRFDEHGNGRGRAGREDLCLNDGWTPSDARPKIVYSTAQPRVRPPVVEPGTLGVQKYGVQMVTPKLIWVYRNGVETDPGKPCFIKAHLKMMPQVHKFLTKEIQPLGGPCRRLYDQNFQLVKSVAELVDGAKYLATSGEPPVPCERLAKFLSIYIET